MRAGTPKIGNNETQGSVANIGRPICRRSGHIGSKREPFAEPGIMESGL
jgi:hypothetical protein